ncbi:MAG: YopX family protein [Ruthenibacterium sp.]
MTREILFRGFHEDENGSTTIYVDGRTVKGEWFYGFYNKFRRNKDEKLEHFIHILDENQCVGLAVDVIPATIGEYTGYEDKNDNKIFEGSRVMNKDNNLGVVLLGVVPKELASRNFWHFAFYVKFVNAYLRPELPFWADKIEVVGTVFDKKVKK